MDPDFADFLLDESHLDLKQKRVDDADFLEGLKITDNDEEEFLLKVEFEPESRQKKHDEVDFDIPFEITSEDLELLEAQEKTLTKVGDARTSNTPKKQGSRRIYSTTGNKENMNDSRNSTGANEVDKLKVDLELYKDRAESLNQELNAQKRQILTKEGEITILRQRLIQLDNEKLLIAQKYSELTESSRKAAEKLEIKWQKETEHLKTELLFKEQELRSLSSIKRKLPKSSGTFLDNNDINTFGTIKNDPLVSKKLPDSSPSNRNKDIYSSMNDLEVFSSFILKVDQTWRFSELKEFDALDIIKAREFACDEIRKFSYQEGKSSLGRALAFGIVKLFERALYFRQPILLTYVSQLFAEIFDNCGDRLKDEIQAIRDQNNAIIFFQQIVILLTGKVIFEGIPKEIILNQFVIINVILYQLEMKIPEEFKAIVNSGFLQWILRCNKFSGKETKIIGMILYSLSCDLNMLSAVYLSSASDKIECMSVLDLLLAKADNLMDSLFPRGKIYRSRFGSQLPLLEDEEDRLIKVDMILSLLFSFVHRSLGPVTLWMPEKLILSQVIWAIDVFDHDWKAATETMEFLPTKILIAQEELLNTIYSGLAVAWHSKDIVMPDILRETRIPLLYTTQQITNHMSSYGGAVKSASILSKIIDREVSDDIKSVYETGFLPRSKSRPH